MTPVKTSELNGAALDWAVSMVVENSRRFPIWLDGKPMNYAAYSTDWTLAGEIIERERISIEHCWDADEDSPAMWLATRIENPAFSEEQGATPLIAAMRCYVASKLGDKVEIPNELKG